MPVRIRQGLESKRRPGSSGWLSHSLALRGSQASEQMTLRGLASEDHLRVAAR